MRFEDLQEGDYFTTSAGPVIFKKIKPQGPPWPGSCYDDDPPWNALNLSGDLTFTVHFCSSEEVVRRTKR